MNEFLTKLANEFHPPFHNSVLIFAVILFIILISPLIFRRIKIPGIIVLIISGLIIGPHGLNLIERNDAVVLFSTIGLLYIMFLAGLDLDLNEFAKNRHKSFLFGFMTFTIPLVLGFPVCHYLLGYNFLTSLLTASMFSTHTLIAYPIVSRLNITRNEAVAITVGGTIITDTAVLVILALITGSQQNGIGIELWARLGISFVLFFLFMYYVIPAISAWFFKKLENERYSHYIFVLAMVFFSAFLAELSGLEPVIGAFAAGLVLNKLIPKTSPLMNRVEFVGNSLFIPFFLISVGMIIDPAAIKNGSWAMTVALVLSVFAIFSKWLAAWSTSTILKYTGVQRRLIFGLSSSHAVATLAVITVGYRIGIIDSHILNGTIILILITCMVASFVTENAARTIALEEESSENNPDIPLEEKILVPIANPETMTKLIDLALSFSTQKRNIPVYGLSVVHDNEEAIQKLAQSRLVLEKLIVHAAEIDRKVEVISTIDQNVASGIRRVVKEILATEILIGTSPKTKLSDAIFGKLMDHIINSTNQMIYIYNPVSNLDVYKNFRIVCPPYSGKEFGFESWISRVAVLSQNANTKCFFYCHKETTAKIEAALKRQKFNLEPGFLEYTNMEGLFSTTTQFNDTDLILLIYPRKGSISYNADFSRFYDMLDKNYTKISYLVISPKVKDTYNNEELIQDVN